MKCPCGRDSTFDTCCEPLLKGIQPAVTAEALMRSRYVAYGLGLETYLRDTWHPAHRPDSISFDPQQKWLGLKILSTVAGQKDDESGEVEFLARYKQAGKGYRLHERSQFVRHNAGWLYSTGEILER